MDIKAPAPHAAATLEPEHLLELRRDGHSVLGRLKVAVPGRIEPTAQDDFAAAPVIPSKESLSPRHQEKLHQLERRTALTDLLTVQKRDVGAVAFGVDQMAPAITVLGSARLRPGDSDYERVVELGRASADAGRPERTGGGPGVMEAALVGYQARRAELGGPYGRKQRTQGVNIALPHEQKLNPAIELRATAEEFPVRKMGLMKNALGFVACPGGFGTLEEVFDVLGLRSRNEITGALAIYGKDFGKLIRTLLEVADRNEDPARRATLAQVRYTEDPAETIQAALTEADRVGEQDTVAQAGARFKSDLERNYAKLSELPPAVVMSGGRGIPKDHPALGALGGAAHRLAQKGFTLRVGDAPGVARAASDGVAQGGAGAKVQLFLEQGQKQPKGSALELRGTALTYLGGKEQMQRSVQGAIFGPPDRDTLGKLFSLLTEIQTGKSPKIPIVLVGKSDWERVMAAVRDYMLGGERQFISPEDMDLFTMTDDPQAIAQAFGDRPAEPLRVTTRDMAAARDAGQRRLAKLGPDGLKASIRESIAVRSRSARKPTPAEVAQLPPELMDLLFSREVLDELKHLPNLDHELATRPKPRGFTFSVDPEGAKDLDNALSYLEEPDGTKVITVSASDVAAYVRPGSALDFAARRRVETAYLDASGLVLPMLPLSLSEGKLSLFEGKPRLAKSVELRISPDGKLSTRIFSTSLTNQRQLTETQAEDILTGHPGVEERPEVAQALHGICDTAGQLVGAKGPLNMEESLALFTILSASQVGDALANAGIEAEFRNQLEPWTRAYYDAQPVAHVSLGTRTYARWTAGLRRYADIESQRAITRLESGQGRSPQVIALDHKLRELQLQRANGESQPQGRGISPSVERITRRKQVD